MVDADVADVGDANVDVDVVEEGEDDGVVAADAPSLDVPVIIELDRNNGLARRTAGGGGHWSTERTDPAARDNNASGHGEPPTLRSTASGIFSGIS